MPEAENEGDSGDSDAELTAAPDIMIDSDSEPEALEGETAPVKEEENWVGEVDQDRRGEVDKEPLAEKDTCVLFDAEHRALNDALSRALAVAQ